MHDLPPIVTHLYLRLLLGGFSILLGAAFLKIHCDRHKDSLWGRISRFGQKDRSPTQAAFLGDRIYLLIGCLSLVGGLIVLLYGFRPTMVG